MPVTRSGKPSIPTTSSSSAILPTEIIHQILSYSASKNCQGTLASCCLVSKRFYKITSPILWKHLILSPWKTNEDGIKIISNQKVQCGSIKNRQKNGTALRKGVKTFSIYNHPPDWCRSDLESNIPLPNLYTLHIHLNKDHCHHDAPHEDDDCRLLRASKPKVLVVHNVGLTYVALKLECLPGIIFEEVEILFLVSNALDPFHEHYSQVVDLPNIPKLKMIFWLFVPIVGKPITGRPRWAFNFNLRSHEECIVKLAHKVQGVPFTMINVGIVKVDIKDQTYTSIVKRQEQTERVVKYQHKCNLEAVGSSAEFCEKEAQNIRFIGLQEFLDQEEWWKYLEEKEVNSWIELMDKTLRPSQGEKEEEQIIG